MKSNIEIYKKNNNKNGFTLIELLAVIVILAIIALIAVPIVLNLIEKARKGAAEDSAYALRKSAELYYTTSLLENAFITDIEFQCNKNDGCISELLDKNQNKIKLEINGTNPESGKIKIKSNGDIIYSDIIINGYICKIETNKPIHCSKSDKEFLIDPVINSSNGYMRLTKYGIEKPLSVTIDYDNKSSKNYYSINDGEWTEYDGLIKLNNNDVVKAKSVSEDGIETEVVSATITIADDALNMDAYDNNIDSAHILSTNLEKFIDVEPYTEEFEFLLYNWAASLTINFYNQNNEVIKSEEHTNTKPQLDTFIVPIGTTKIGFYAGSTPELYELYIDNAPSIIEESREETTINEYAISKGFANVKIEYNDNVKTKLYSTDGINWLPYNDELIKVKYTETIYAQGIIDDNIETYISSITVQKPDEILDSKSYDGKDETYYAFAKGAEKFVYVEELSKSFDFKMRYYATTLKVNFYDKDNNLKESRTYSNSTPGTDTVTIPSETAKIGFYAGSTPNLYEIYIDNTPSIIEESREETKITKNEISKGYANLKISYKDNVKTKLYSLDGENWLPYNDELIKVSYDETLYAKGIIDDDLETKVSSLTVEIPSGMLNSKAYDNDEKTDDVINKGSEKYIYIDEEMAGFSIGFIYWTSSLKLKYYDVNNELIETQSYSSSAAVTDFSVVPQGAVKLGFYAGGEPNIYEVYPNNAPSIIEDSRIETKITKNEISKGYANLKISYKDNVKTKLYSLDGENWLPYNDELIKVSYDETLYAKGIIDDDLETKVSSLTVEIPSGMLNLKAYDNDEKTYDAINKGSEKYIYIDEEMAGFSIGFIYWTLSLKLKYYDVNNELIETQSYSSSAAVTDFSVVPQGAVKLGFYAGGEPSIYEVYPNNAPSIMENSRVETMITQDGVSKGYTNIKIEYKENVKTKLYSLDGENWLPYNDELIKVTIDDTIYAKGIMTDNIETNIRSLTVLPTENTISNKTFDKNDVTYYEFSKGSEKFIYVKDESKDFNFFMKLWGSSLTVKFYGKDNELLNSEHYSNSAPTLETVTVPAGTVKIGFYAGSGPYIYEIYGDSFPTIVEESRVETTISPNGIVKGYTNIKIEYKDTVKTKLYSFDGENWLPYNDGLIKVEYDQTIYAKGITYSGMQTEISTLTVNIPTDILGVGAYDPMGNDTYDQISKGNEKFIYVEPQSEPFDFTMSYYATSITLKFYDSNNGLISSQKYTNSKISLGTVTVPAGTVKIGFYAGSNPLVHDIYI